MRISKFQEHSRPPAGQSIPHSTAKVMTAAPPESSSKYQDLIFATQSSLEFSSIVIKIIDTLVPWHEKSPLLAKFLSAYDSGNSKQLKAICSPIAGEKGCHAEVLKAVYRCVREYIEAPKHINVDLGGRRHAVPDPVKRMVGNELHEIGLKRWPSIPLDQIFWVLRKNDLVPLQEDGTEWSGFLMGEKMCGDDRANEQHADFLLAFDRGGKWVLANTAVHLSWCVLRLEPKTFEIVVYMG